MDEKKIYGKGWAGDPKRLDAASVLDTKFIYQPFSILNASRSAWIQRKRVWIKLGIKGELGRNVGERDAGRDLGDVFTKNLDGHGADLRKKFKRRKDFGKTYNATLGEYRDIDKIAAGKDVPIDSGTSVFDPVLCELMYRWFCPEGGCIFDPFAGESTKGIVATILGYDYVGIELRKDQIKANDKQAKRIGVAPTWIKGDSIQIRMLVPKEKKFDLIFTSPPYYDLELYSDLTKDGSAIPTYDKFMLWYGAIFESAVNKLKDNRFLVVKVGEIRDPKTGIYRNFIADNIEIFQDVGLHYYNEMILITTAGSLPLRTSKQFNKSRKIGKCHQTILVFYKGDAREIHQHFGKIPYTKSQEE